MVEKMGKRKARKMEIFKEHFMDSYREPALVYQEHLDTCKVCGEMRKEFNGYQLVLNDKKLAPRLMRLIRTT